MDGDNENEFLVFSPDSPLFGVAATDAVNDILHLSDFLSSIVMKMKKLCESLKNTAMAGNALASQMQGTGIGGTLKNSGFVSPVIKHFGGILSGISSSQEILADCLENVFIAPLEAFNMTEIPKIALLQQQYKKEHKANEECILRYLQGDTSNSFGMSRNSRQAVLSFRALEVVQQRKKFEMSRFDFVREVNTIKAQKNFEIAEACISVLFALRNHHRESAERLQSSSGITNELTERQYEARTRHSASLIPVNTLSSGMSSVLDTMIERVDTQLPSSTVGAYSLDGFESIVRVIDPMHVDSAYYSNLGLSASDINVTAAATEAITRLGSIGASLMGGFSVPKPVLQNSNTHAIQFDQEKRIHTEKGSSRLSIPSSIFGDVEMRMKALDKHQLERFYSPLSTLEYSGLIKQGYLLERSAAKMLVQPTWSREWFVLDDSKLYIIKEKERGEKDSGSSLDVQVVCETMLASVRELKTSEVPFVFEISYANRSSHTLQAEGYKEYDAWVGAIRLAIERRLIGATSIPFPPSLSSSSHPSSSQVASTMKKRQLSANLVQNVLQMSKYCAECDKADPDWVSLNLGCLICIDCSGIHRSLGVHISKVRSLTLDDLDPEEYNLLLRIGNDVGNSVWEAKAPKDPKKPRPQDSHAVREKFIKAKYLLKLFLLPDSQMKPSNAESKLVGEGNLNECLRAACRVDDVAAALKAIAHGADVCPSSKNTPSAPLPPKRPPPAVLPKVPCLSQIHFDNNPADTDKDESSPQHFTPITTSHGSNHISIGRISNKEDTRGITKQAGCSPLHLAILSGSTACAVLLIMNGADPRSRPAVDDTADYASSSSKGHEGQTSKDETLWAVEGIEEGNREHRLSSLPLTEVAEKAGHRQLAAYLRRKLDTMQISQSPYREVRADTIAPAAPPSPMRLPVCGQSRSTLLKAPCTFDRNTVSDVPNEITVISDNFDPPVDSTSLIQSNVTIQERESLETTFSSVLNSGIETGTEGEAETLTKVRQTEIPESLDKDALDVAGVLVGVEGKLRGMKEEEKEVVGWNGIEEEADEMYDDEDDDEEDEDVDDLEDFYAALMRDESFSKSD